MFHVAKPETTGQAISLLGVLTVLAFNQIEDNHLPDNIRAQVRLEMEAIAKGKRGPETRRVMVRSAERCAMGVWN